MSATITERGRACVEPPPYRCKLHRSEKNIERCVEGTFRDNGDTGSTARNLHTHPWSIVEGHEDSVRSGTNNANADRIGKGSWHNCRRIPLDPDRSKTRQSNVVPANRWDPC